MNTVTATYWRRTPASMAGQPADVWQQVRHTGLTDAKGLQSGGLLLDFGGGHTLCEAPGDWHSLEQWSERVHATPDQPTPAAFATTYTGRD